MLLIVLTATFIIGCDNTPDGDMPVAAQDTLNNAEDELKDSIDKALLELKNADDLMSRNMLFYPAEEELNDCIARLNDSLKTENNSLLKVYTANVKEKTSEIEQRIELNKQSIRDEMENFDLIDYHFDMAETTIKEAEELLSSKQLSTANNTEIEQMIEAMKQEMNSVLQIENVTMSDTMQLFECTLELVSYVFFMTAAPDATDHFWVNDGLDTLDSFESEIVESVILKVIEKVEEDTPFVLFGESILDFSIAGLLFHEEYPELQSNKNLYDRYMRCAKIVEDLSAEPREEFFAARDRADDLLSLIRNDLRGAFSEKEITEIEEIESRLGYLQYASFSAKKINEEADKLNAFIKSKEDRIGELVVFDGSG